MATQFSDLQKLLINVAPDKCDAFIKAHINDTWTGTGELPTFTAAETDAYYNKVVFLKKYNTIYTKGTFFGYTGDLKASFDDLFNDLTNAGLSANGITVRYDAAENAIVTNVDAATYTTAAGWVNVDNVVTGTTVKTYVDEKVAGAVAEATAAMNFCGEINEGTLTSIQATANNGDVYVVGTGFTADGKKFEAGDLVIFRKGEEDATATYIVVERNLDDAIVKDTDFNNGQIVVASGTDKVKTTGYTFGGAILSDDTTNASTVLATESAVSAAIGTAVTNMTHNNGSGQGTYMTYTYHTTNGITYIDSIDPKLSTINTTYGDNGEYILGDATTGLVDHTTLNYVISYYDGAISYLDRKINAIDCEVTTLTEVDNDYLTVVENSADDDNDRNYTIGLNVVSLGDAVGMTYDEATGKWSAPEGSTAVNGLASAADVANELVNDEKVIAAALNDHETRIDTLEGFANDIDNTIQTQLVRGEVTINGLTATATKEGLVDATILANAINALDPWEEYA